MACEFTVGGRAPTLEEQGVILTALGIDSASGITYFGGTFGELVASTGAGDATAFASKGSVWTPQVDVSVTQMSACFTPLASTDTYRFGIASINQTTSNVTAILFQTSALVTGTTERVLTSFDMPAAIQLSAGVKYLFYVSFVNAATTTTAVRTVAGTFTGPGSPLHAGGPIAYNVNAVYASMDLIVGDVHAGTGVASPFIVGPTRGFFNIGDYVALF